MLVVGIKADLVGNQYLNQYYTQIKMSKSTLIAKRYSNKMIKANNNINDKSLITSEFLMILETKRKSLIVKTSMVSSLL